MLNMCVQTGVLTSHTSRLYIIYYRLYLVNRRMTTHFKCLTS